MLYKVLPRVGREWQPLDIDQVLRTGVTLVARFLIGYCHLGGFSLPWDPLESVPCLLYGGEFSQEHLQWECSIVIEEREEFLSQGFGNKGKKPRLSCTLECRLLEPVSFGHLANLSDGQFGGSFLRLSVFMRWSR